jgi:hypothetical protein
MIGAVLLLAALSVGCAGPSKARLHALLGQCREQNRERTRIIKAYEQSHCIVHPEQEAGRLEFDEAGY